MEATNETGKNPAGAQSRAGEAGANLSVGLERKFDTWVHDGRRLGDMETLFAWEAWKAATITERAACANALNISRSDALLMAGEMTAQEWRTLSAVLVALQNRMRSNVRNEGLPRLSAVPLD